MRRAWRLLSIRVLMGLALLSLPVVPASARQTTTGTDEFVAAQTDQTAGNWPTWAIQSGAQFRLPPPPDAEATRDEIDVLEELAVQRDPAALDVINYWDTGAPAFRWNNQTVQLLLAKGIAVPRASRAMALLNVAIHDATVAAWDSKYTYNRARPADFDHGLASAIPTPASPAYPSEHAVTAGAAEAVLSYLFPDDAVMVNGWAEEAGRSRTLAGTDYPSDVAAGLELGRQVGAVVVDWAKNDGTTATWTGTVPTGPGLWVGTNPAEPMAGTWKTWAISAGDQFRPGPRAAYDSPEMRQELDEVKNFPRTNLTNLNASYWEYYGGRASFEFWANQANRMIFEHRLDSDPPQAARVYALMGVAFYDSFVACWDAKYTYWAARPAMLDPAITTVFLTPNHPSYPSAHGCLTTGAGTVMASLFPREASYYEAMVAEVSNARIRGGIHVRSDQVAGEAIGRSVAGVVMAHSTGR
jgi:membrane-associated phospholipid phosphatase